MDSTGKSREVALKNLKLQFNLSAVEHKLDLIHGLKYERQVAVDEQLENCDISGPALEGVHFTRCSFNNCRFDEVSMAGCWLIDCQFTGCSFDRVNMSGCLFRGCQFESTSWNEVKLRGAKFIDIDLTGVKMIGCETGPTFISSSTQVSEVQAQHFITHAEFREQTLAKPKEEKTAKVVLEGQARELHIIKRFESRMSSSAIRAIRRAVGRDEDRPFIRSYISQHPDCSLELSTKYASFLILEAVHGAKPFKVEAIQLTHAGERTLEWREIERMATEFVLEAKKLRDLMF